MMTSSGLLVRRDNQVAPTLRDIATSLSRQPRFGGHAFRPWSVAEHSMSCANFVRDSQGDPLIELYALLHDAHECVTGDVPSTWKTPDLREVQKELDRRIFSSLGLAPMHDDVKAYIKRIDRAILLAESQSVGPVDSYPHICRDLIEYDGHLPAKEDVKAAMWAVGDIVASFPSYRNERDLAGTFFERATKLLAKLSL